MKAQSVKSLIVLSVLLGSVYFADDFVREFGFRALPVGVLLVLAVCYAILKAPQ